MTDDVKYRYMLLPPCYPSLCPQSIYLRSAPVVHGLVDIPRGVSDAGHRGGHMGDEALIGSRRVGRSEDPTVGLVRRPDGT